MKIFRFSILFLTLLFSAFYVCAQVDVENPRSNGFDRPNRQPGRIKLLRELGLSQEQIQQVRLINQKMKPMRQAAQRRHAQAKRQLDMSIYSDVTDEAIIRNNVKAVAEAQAEIIKLRAQSELAIRNILTPEQLVKFREIRRNFELRKKRREMRRKRMLNRQKRRQQNNQ